MNDETDNTEPAFADLGNFLALFDDATAEQIRRDLEATAAPFVALLITNDDDPPERLH